MISDILKLCKILSFHGSVIFIFTPLEYCTMLMGNLLLAFQDNASVLFSSQAVHEECQIRWMHEYVQGSSSMRLADRNTLWWTIRVLGTLKRAVTEVSCIKMMKALRNSHQSIEERWIQERGMIMVDTVKQTLCPGYGSSFVPWWPDYFVLSIMVYSCQCDERKKKGFQCK